MRLLQQQLDGVQCALLLLIKEEHFSGFAETRLLFSRAGSAPEAFVLLWYKIIFLLFSCSQDIDLICDT